MIQAVLQYSLRRPDYAARKREGRNTAAGGLRLQLGVPQEFFPRFRCQRNKRHKNKENNSGKKIYIPWMWAWPEDSSASGNPRPLKANRSVNVCQSCRRPQRGAPHNFIQFNIGLFFFLAVEDNFGQCQLCLRRKNCPTAILSRRRVLYCLAFLSSQWGEFHSWTTLPITLILSGLFVLIPQIFSSPPTLKQVQTIQITYSYGVHILAAILTFSSS